MKRCLFPPLNTFLFFLLFLSVCTSCSNTKYTRYFDNIQDTTLPATVTGLEPVIQKGDLLSISVGSLSPETTTLFNTTNVPAVGGSSLSSSTLSQAVGYLVSQNGTIDFPMLGTLSVAGLTKEALKNLVAKSLEDKKLLFDPIVTVSYLNFHVTVLGEVNNPGVVTITNEQATLLEAIGMAGDLTIYGKRDNVLLLRKENGQKIVRRLNLNSDKILTSPYFYLKTNDVVYVEPNSNKVASVSQAKIWAPIILSALSLLIIFVDHMTYRK